MDARAMLDALTVAVRLKDTTRHCYTEKGRHESVAENCWMMTLMAFFMRDEFPEADSTKVVTVEVPQQAPAMVPTASAVRASFILGILPS